MLKCVQKTLVSHRFHTKKHRHGIAVEIFPSFKSRCSKDPFACEKVINVFFCLGQEFRMINDLFNIVNTRAILFCWRMIVWFWISKILGGKKQTLLCDLRKSRFVGLLFQQLHGLAGDSPWQIQPCLRHAISDFGAEMARKEWDLVHLMQHYNT